MTMVPVAMVERAARALFGGPGLNWGQLPQFEKDRFRDQARIALTAALEGHDKRVAAQALRDVRAELLSEHPTHQWVHAWLDSRAQSLAPELPSERTTD